MMRRYKAEKEGDMGGGGVGVGGQSWNEKRRQRGEEKEEK